MRRLKCPSCGERGTMHVEKHINPKEATTFIGFLKRTFLPSGIDLNDTFICSYCSEKMESVPFVERVAIPAILIAGSIIAVIAFLAYILLVVTPD